MNRISAADAFAAALRGEPCRLVGVGDTPSDLGARRWCADADHLDEIVLNRCRGATVDIGCGPGRLTYALMSRGLAALGIDVVPEAVQQTLARGGTAMQRDVFSPLPGEGRWATALLADGNIGIGGDPLRLLSRASELIAQSGRVVVDLDEPGWPIQVHKVVLEVGAARTPPFRWATVPADQLEPIAKAAAMRVLEIVADRGRYVGTLVKES
jgi:SAM-dependent methyltransferase